MRFDLIPLIDLLKTKKELLSFEEFKKEEFKEELKKFSEDSSWESWFMIEQNKK